MLQLHNIRFESSYKLFNVNSKKLIRFSNKNSIITSKKICTFVNQATIKWEETLRLPQIYTQEFDFEIYNQHQFGYNPQELQNLLFGSVKFNQGKTIGKCQVMSSADSSKKVGFLIFDIKKLQRSPSQARSPIQQKTSKTLCSIIARNIKDCPQSAFITVNNGKKNYKSQTVQQIKGQFFYNLMFKNDSYLIKSTSPNDTLVVSFHLPNGDSLGKAYYSFKNQNNLHKVDINKQENDEKIGQMYFEVQIEQLMPKTDNNKMEKSTFEQQIEKVDKAYEPAPKKSSTSLSKIRSMSLTRLSKMGESQFLGTSRTKRMSVIHNNGDVVFPSEKRFMLYQDKQTNVISYSKLPSMKFEQQHSKKYYKGASIGVGNKSDFTAYYRYNPGVGQYRLPSIFDRY